MAARPAIDPRIQDLPSTTFFGKRLTRRQIADVQEMVQACSGLSRTELALTVCEHWHWQAGSGASRVRLATRLLEQLAEHGIVSLPAKRPRPRGPDRAVALTERTAPQPPIAADLASLRPLRLDAVADRPGFAAWQEWVARYHPLGYRKPLGCYVAYFLRDCRERLLGCLLFDPAARRLPCRDEWIGWQDEPYHAHLQLVVRNARFLLLPWVQVKNLASHALALAARQLPADWHKLHRSRPVLLETYVNAEQHAGTCYKAAGWQLPGLTAGRKAHGRQPAQAPKQVWALPLRPDFRKLLRHGPFASRRRRPRAVAADAARRRRQFTALWEDLLAAIGDRLRRYDREWMQRRRKVNTLLVVLFVFRLVLAPRLQGYGPTLTELWGQCRQQGLFPPHDDPVSASSMCVARGKVGRRPFLRMQRALLARVPTDAPRWLWRGHRVFAVDGSKIHLPRRLRRDRYRCPSDRSHYPQGLLSSLFQLRARLPFDLDLSCHENERRAARDHLRALRPGDVVVCDRGYYSFALLHACARRGLHPVFRLQANASGLVRDFIPSDDADRTVPVEPTQTAPQQQPDAVLQPVPARFVNYTAGGNDYTLATTLLDRKRYSRHALADLYHARWGVEEHYKLVKRLLRLEPFHGQSEDLVLQQLWACFTLIAMTRLFANHCEAEMPSAAGKPPLRANFNNSLRTVSQHIEWLLLQQSAALSTTVDSILRSMDCCRQRERPNRSYPRVTRRPDDRWRPSKKK